MPTSLSTERLSRISAWQSALVDQGAVPCALTLVNQGGETAFLEGAGWASVPGRDPIRNDSIFRLYSMTKPIVSIALLQLYEEGRFQLGDPLHQYLGPKWRKEHLRVFAGWNGDDEARKSLDYATEPCASDITVGQILTHTAGLSYGFDPSGRGIPVDRVYAKTLRHPARKDAPRDPNDPSMMAAFCDALAEMPLLYQPGTQWNYSYAADVSGALIEVLSGQPLDQFLAERLTGPLGMSDTAFDVPADKADRLVRNTRYVAPADAEGGPVTADRALVWPHVGSFEDVDDASRAGYLNGERPKFLSGGGGLVGTIGDYSAFCSMLLAGGVTPDGTRLLGRKTLQFATSNHLPGGAGLMDLVPKPEFQYSETAKNGGSFGLGFSVVESPQAAQLIGSVGSFAWGGAAATLFWCDPVEDLHVIFCTQVMGMQPPNMLRAKLGSLVYSSLT